MNLQPINHEASKQEEIDLLNKVASLFHKGTYMADFFSEKCLAWVKEQIKNDFPPELFEAIQHERDNHSETLKASLKKDVIIRELETRNEQLAYNMNTLSEARSREDKEHIVDIQSYRNAYEEASFKNDGLIASNTQLHELVKTLKVEIYDLTHQK